MRRFACLLLASTLLLGLGLSANLFAQAPQGLITLSELRNVACPLLIFASKPDDARLEIQLRTLNEHSAEAADHAIVPVAIPFQNPSPTDAKLSPAESISLRRRYDVAPADFVVILLNRDGRQLVRSTKPLSMHRLDEAFSPGGPRP